MEPWNEKRNGMANAHNLCNYTTCVTSAVVQGCTSYYVSRALILASSPGPTQILSRSHGEKSGEGLGAKLRYDQKWWTRLVRNVDSVS